MNYITMAYILTTRSFICIFNYLDVKAVLLYVSSLNPVGH